MELAACLVDSTRLGFFAFVNRFVAMACFGGLFESCLPLSTGTVANEIAIVLLMIDNLCI